MADFYPHGSHPRYEEIARKVLESNLLDDPTYDLCSAYAAVDSMVYDGRTMVEIEAQADFILTHYTIPQVIFVNEPQWKELLGLLDAPAKPNEALSRLFHRPTPFS